MKQLHWGIIGTGAIAKAFAHGLKASATGKLVAVGSRTKQSAEEFGSQHGVDACHGSYQALLEDETVQAVYISTPHPFHAEWAIKATEAGKHVLCEKPLALNQWQGQAIIESARKNAVYLSEAFMYRFHPQTAKLVELIREGAIGEVRMIRASFGFDVKNGYNPEGRLFKNELGGGGILDVGCYAVSGARLVAGAAVGKPFDNPVQVSGCAKLSPTGVDEWAAAVLQFDSGITAHVTCATRVQLENELVVYGSDGQVTVSNPWVADRQNAVTGKIIVKNGGEQTVHEIPATATSFALEADGVAKAISSGKCEPDSPAMTWKDTLGNLAALDEWRRQAGVVYIDEQPAKRPVDLARRKVRSHATDPSVRMKYGKIPGLDKPVSKLIYGALTAHGSFAKAQVLFDHWLEVGGNAFDTSFHYGMGKCDFLLGEWLQSRGIREDVVIVAKGAHTPWCNPENLTHQLLRSLECLKTDYTDIYVMHRDNEDIPVGEFIDVLNEHVDAGRVRIFGGSNWSPERFFEANAYAAAHGKQGMSILNNNLSLARMVDPVWEGCLHMSDPDSRKWMTEHKVTHFAWSSQARGFFTGRTDLELKEPGYDPELRRCWLSEDNLKRRQRAIEMAQAKGVLPINIAAAYVLNQPFDSYALIGPESIEEMVTSLPAIDFQLSEEEVRFLWEG
jgi:predicted dehydrogenase/aryl-alcohol dehydrogenase-like predicted oxidoreductase